ANAMLANGIKVYLYPGMSHIKAAVYDGWACLGSANFDKASLHLNEEINIATSHPPAVDDLLERLFLPDFEKSRELTQEYKIAAIDYISELIADQL
ncbi:MAG: phospholipase D-like domain-containing protein, partial [bacterium]